MAENEMIETIEDKAVKDEVAGVEVFKKNLPLYILTALLLLTYLVILIKGLDKSRLDTAYRMFYIDDELKYWADMEELGNYREDTLFELRESGNYRNLGKGWLLVGEKATWCVGNKSDFYIYIDEPEKPHELVLDIKKDMGYKNYITVNGVYQGDVSINDDKASVTISSGLKEGLNKFSICTDEEVADVNEDRALNRQDGRRNLCVRSIMLTRGSMCNSA